MFGRRLAIVSSLLLGACFDEAPMLSTETDDNVGSSSSSSTGSEGSTADATTAADSTGVLPGTTVMFDLIEHACSPETTWESKSTDETILLGCDPPVGFAGIREETPEGGEGFALSIQPPSGGQDVRGTFVFVDESTVPHGESAFFRTTIRCTTLISDDPCGLSVSVSLPDGSAQTLVLDQTPAVSGSPVEVTAPVTGLKDNDRILVVVSAADDHAPGARLLLVNPRIEP